MGKIEVYKTIKFSIVGGLPIIKCTINGKKARLLIDTGATSSFLDLNQRGKYDFKISKSDADVAGIGGSRDIYRVKDLVLKFGHSEIKHTFKATDLSDVAKVKHIVGIIGTDFLKKRNAMINYKDKFITYSI